MKRKPVLALFAAALATLFVGCEWTHSSDDSSWSGRYDSMNFAGSYRIVKVTVVGVDGSGDAQAVVDKPTGQTVASGAYNYSGSIGAAIVAGSFSIKIGNKGSLHDLNGDGNLVSDGVNASGAVNSASGQWSITLYNNQYAGQSLTISYQLAPLADGSSSTSYTGIDTTAYDGTKVSAIAVGQTGQYLTLGFNNGVTMSGRFTSVRQTGTINEDTGAGAETYNAQFQASGSSGKIVGTLYYDYTSHNRVLDGTWTYGKNVYDVHAIGPAWTSSGSSNVADTTN